MHAPKFLTIVCPPSMYVNKVHDFILVWNKCKIVENIQRIPIFYLFYSLKIGYNKNESYKVHKGLGMLRLSKADSFNHPFFLALRLHWYKKKTTNVKTLLYDSIVWCETSGKELLCGTISRYSLSWSSNMHIHGENKHMLSLSLSPPSPIARKAILGHHTPYLSYSTMPRL